jgi:DNA replication protein DnaC
VNHEEIKTTLLGLKLSAMARDFVEAAKLAEKKQLTYEQYLANLTLAEFNERHSAKVRRFIKEAGLPMVKTEADFDFKKRTGITDKQFARLTDGVFLKEATNIVFYGDFSVGKTHLALALAHNLCQKGYRCLFTPTNILIEQMILAKKNQTILNLMKRLDRYDLIVCDELGYIPQEPQGADLFFQLISQRSERKSIAITTNLTYSEWEKIFLNPLTTSAAVERIIANCETFHIKGPSWRKEMAKKKLDSLTTSQTETTT